MGYWVGANYNLRVARERYAVDVVFAGYQCHDLIASEINIPVFTRGRAKSGDRDRSRAEGLGGIDVGVPRRRYDWRIQRDRLRQLDQSSRDLRGATRQCRNVVV